MSGGIEGFRQSLIETYNQNKELSKEQLVQKLVDKAATNEIKNGDQQITEAEIKVLDEFIEKNLKGKFDIKSGNSSAEWTLELEETLPNKTSSNIKGKEELFNRLDKTINEMKKNNQLPKELNGKSTQEIKDILEKNKDNIREKFQNGLEKTLKKEGFDADESQKIAKQLTNNLSQKPVSKSSTETITKESEIVKSDHTTTEVKNEKDKSLKLQNKENIVKISQDQPYLDLAKDKRNWINEPNSQENINDFNFYQRSELGKSAGATGKDLSQEFPDADSLMSHMEKNPEDFDKFAKMSNDDKKAIAERIIKYYTTGNFKIKDFQNDMASISTKLANQLAENGANKGIDNKKGYATTLTMRYFSAMMVNTPKEETKNYHTEGKVKINQKQTNIEQEYKDTKVNLTPEKATYKKVKPIEGFVGVTITHKPQKYKGQCPTFRDRGSGGPTSIGFDVTLRSSEKAREMTNKNKLKAQEKAQENYQETLEKANKLENNFGVDVEVNKPRVSKK